MLTDPTRPKILLVADVPNWIFSRHAAVLRELLGDEFAFSVRYRAESYDEEEYDLIYPFEYNLVNTAQIRRPMKYVTGIRSFVSWFDVDFISLVSQLQHSFQNLHVVSEQLHNLFSPFFPDSKYITHGVDTQLFRPASKTLSPAGKLKLGWAGNRNTFVKGYLEFIQPLIQISGVELISCGFSQQELSVDEMPGFYHSIDAFISASSFEGNNNAVLEAASTGTAIITTDAGTVPEYLVDGKSSLIVDRTSEDIQNAVLRLRDSPDLRITLGQQARQAVLDGGWDWKHKAQDYRRFFRESLANTKRSPPVQEASPSSATPSDWLRIIECQNELLREARNYLLMATGGGEILNSLDEKINWIIKQEAYARLLENNIDQLENNIDQLEKDTREKIAWISKLEAYARQLESENKEIVSKFSVIEKSRLLKYHYWAVTGQLLNQLKSKIK